MERISRREALRMLGVTTGMTALGGPSLVRAASAQDLRGRIVALGIPGASAISPVGTFLRGGPIHDNPAFAVYTQPGRILDPVRILVGAGRTLAPAWRILRRTRGRSCPSIRAASRP